MFKKILIIFLLLVGLTAGGAGAFDAVYDKAPECFMSIDYTVAEGSVPNVLVIKSTKAIYNRNYLRQAGDVWTEAAMPKEEVIPCDLAGTVSPVWICPEEAEQVVPLPLSDISEAPEIMTYPVFEPKKFIVYFDFDKDIIKANQEDTLAEAAAYADKFGEARVLLEASCDFRGSDAYNIELGERRATAVEHWLIENGVGAGRFLPITNNGDRLSPFRIMKGIFCADCWEDRWVKISIDE